MNDHEKGGEELLAEVRSLRKKVSELESALQAKNQTAQELQNSEHVLEMIINNIPNQVFWKDIDLTYIGSNQAFAEVTGMKSPAEVIGKTDYDFQRDSTHADSYREWDRKIMESGEAVIDIEESYHNADGGEGTVLTSKVPLRDKEGNVFGLLGICTDITERKKAEHEKESLIQELKAALEKVNTLGGLLPICSNCKKVRDDKGYWQQIELYISDHTGTEFSHSLCQDCAKEIYPHMIDEDGNFNPQK